MNKNFFNFKRKFFLKSGFYKNALIIFIIIFIVIISVTIFLFFKFKSIYTNISSGRQDLIYSWELASRGDFSGAEEFSKSATNHFAVASETLGVLQNSLVSRKIKILNTNLNDFKKLAQLAEVLSGSAGKALSLMKNIEDIFSGKKADNFLDLSLEERVLVLKTLYESYPEIQGIKANIDLSLFYLQQSKDNRFLSSYAGQFDDLSKSLMSISQGLEKTVSLASIIPFLAGYPEPSSYLIILQNNNELRPSGGFIGSYGILELQAGDISKLETHDIYHLDMPASQNPSFKVVPPEAIKKYLGSDRWFMRDANWSPDWPSSAKNLQWFYKEELLASNRASELKDFSGVIAIVPEFITDLLYIVGPIKIGDQIYDQNNFIDILQHEVEISFRENGISEWDRKSVIGDILQKLKTKLFNLPSDRWRELSEVFNKNISQKNILVYLNDDYSRKISTNLNWGGELRANSGDYLMVVDANLAAFKTDRVMDKKIKYYLTEEGDRFRARVELSYQNNGNFDWQTTRYRTFTRVYVPLGANLISSSGSLERVESLIEKNITYPKSYFSSFLSVEPGDKKTLVFEYYLPDDFYKNFKLSNSYSLLLQKQPGSRGSQFEVYLKFSRPIISSKSDLSQDEFFKLNQEKNEIQWNDSLDQDHLLELKF
ncbi:MAG: DUF4012 domain-containing protein [Patescibacteria group bacterium]|nr:DUF4012 domain-containing protein [Patescibacteria group bacterium]